MKYDCLIIDDELELAETTSEYFNMFDVRSAYVTNAEACLTFLEEHEVSLILLDINLGTDSGFALCKQLRITTQVPILFISARSSDDDILIALNIGGDDYIHKPYTLSVLLAKVKAVLRRYETHSVTEGTSGQAPLQPETFIIDQDLCRVRVHGEEIRLKPLEFKLLSYLLEHKNRVVTKEELFRKVWGDVITGDGTLNVHIRHLREKIEDNPNHPQYIKTVWGIGYVFEDRDL
ncbi:response regulator transcription factor [Paenibacillus sp. JCM 10914]|uniref:response regulator transcription factor n=1 Tax=Paenibacillus sp. JCM 10914 TaxID=1236974 RepID=UPI0003CC90B6|nr:response regulator transcription factor [Paenibacillus sp. JCM 10914]GAE06029.1 DNA-binding response regulator [Paenibacillus sp. JCM 10914]